MKKHLLILAVLSMITLSANAKDNGDDCNGNGSCSTGTPTSSTSNAIGVGVGIAGASSHATGGTVYSNFENSVKNTNQNLNTNKQNQNQGQSQSTENSNNAQQNVTVQGNSTVYKAPDIPVSTAIAPPNFPTAPCRIALSAGLSLMNVGGSFGGSVLDTQCDLRASAQAFAAVGDIESAEYLLCSLDASEKLPKCQSKIAVLNANASKENTQTQLSSIIK